MQELQSVELEYGEELLTLKVPVGAEVLSMDHTPALSDPASRIEEALHNPVGGKPLAKIIDVMRKPASDLTAAVTVSDNTRPVPYSCDREDGILMPLLQNLEEAGIAREHITIVIGTGTHAATSAEWKRKALGGAIAEQYKIVDHDCESKTLRSIGSVEGIEVKVNEHFASADLRIATSLAEPHFMAGVSGGAKAICPGIINIDTTRRFHGAEWMGNPKATNLQLEDNPCYRFPLAVARNLGVHFSVNCLNNKEGKLTHIYAGALEPAHRKAAEVVIRTAGIRCRGEYDIVITHGGKVAVNHYQAAKAAFGTIPIIRKGGIVVLAAHNNDPEPVGKPDYKKVLALLMEKEPGTFSGYITSPQWDFVPDQWQVQKWDQFFQKAGGFENLIYCTTHIPRDVLADLPGRSGYSVLDGDEENRKAAGSENTSNAEVMVQAAVDTAVHEMRQRLGREPSIAVLADGPYGVPSIQ
jgi:nickel-dependent lactate racemase